MYRAPVISDALIVGFLVSCFATLQYFGSRHVVVQPEINAEHKRLMQQIETARLQKELTLLHSDIARATAVQKAGTEREKFVF
jgi:hypothetical protein